MRTYFAQTGHYRFAATSGVPRLTAHDLRRTMARLADEAGAAPHDLKEQMGYSSFETTGRYIGKAQEAAARRVAQAILRRTRPVDNGNNLVTGAPSGPRGDLGENA